MSKKLLNIVNIFGILTLWLQNIMFNTCQSFVTAKGWLFFFNEEYSLIISIFFPFENPFFEKVTEVTIS